MKSPIKKTIDRRSLEIFKRPLRSQLLSFLSNCYNYLFFPTTFQSISNPCFLVLGLLPTSDMGRGRWVGGKEVSPCVSLMLALSFSIACPPLLPGPPSPASFLPLSLKRNGVTIFWLRLTTITGKKSFP